MRNEQVGEILVKLKKKIRDEEITEENGMIILLMMYKRKDVVRLKDAALYLYHNRWHIQKTFTNIKNLVDSSSSKEILENI